LVEPEVTPVTQSVRPTICAQCADKSSPEAEQVDGFSFRYEIIKGVTMVVHIRHSVGRRIARCVGVRLHNYP
jgi:hypothetical protein